MALLPVQTTFNIDLQFETAPFHYRFFAWLIDLFILWLFTFIVSHFLLSTFNTDDLRDFGLAELLFTIPILVYHLVCELFLKGQSFAKKIMGIKVVSLSGKRATTSQYLLRWLLRFLDFGFMWCFLLLISGSFFLAALLAISSVTSFIIFITSAYNQRLGDMLAGTAVILKKAPYSLTDTIFKNIDTTAYTVTFPQVMKLSDRDINIINAILQNKHKNKNRWEYIAQVCTKIKTALNIETALFDDDFLETLLNDYNYLSRQ
jgi:uncharacterized RDD family membrane protein YckC